MPTRTRRRARRPTPQTDTRSLRVVHLVTRSHRRGAEVFALELAAASDALGHHHEVHAIGLAGDGGSVAGLPALVPTTRIGLRALLMSGWRFRRILRQHPADVVVAHGGSAAIVAAVAVPSSSLLIWQRILELPSNRWGRLRRMKWRWVAHRFDAVVALTSPMEAEMHDLGYDGPIWQIGNARDPSRFTAVDRRAASTALRAETGIDPDVPILAFVGHLVRQKDPEAAVDVLAEVRRLGHPAHLIIAGEGPLRSAVERRAAQHGVADAVTLLGHRDDPELVYGGSDLTLITSRVEGIPGVAIEAQMSGCPVVTYRLGSVEDVVVEGETGLIVPWTEPTMMANRIASLLADPTRLQAMSHAAVSHGAGFNTAAIASVYAAKFHDLGSTPHEASGAADNP